MSATTIYWFIAFLAMAAWNVYINEHWYKRASKCSDDWYKLTMKNDEEWAELCRKIRAERDALRERVAELEAEGGEE